MESTTYPKTAQDAIDRAKAMIDDNGPHRLSDKDREAIETLMLLALKFCPSREELTLAPEDRTYPQNR